SINHSDAVVMGSKVLSESLINYIETSNKPFLPFVDKENQKEAYNNFLKSKVLK
ncbi:MAG TPA: glycogen synthase, partial [Flavobacterium sp.]|nr:glycogen synthase [Flavobacterium sp.]